MQRARRLGLRSRFTPFDSLYGTGDGPRPVRLPPGPWFLAGGGAPTLKGGWVPKMLSANGFQRDGGLTGYRPLTLGECVLSGPLQATYCSGLLRVPLSACPDLLPSAQGGEMLAVSPAFAEP